MARFASDECGMRLAIVSDLKAKLLPAIRIGMASCTVGRAP